MSELLASPEQPSTDRLPRWEMRPMDFALFPCLVLTALVALSLAFVSAFTALTGQEPSEDSLSFGIVAGAGTQVGLLVALFAFRHLTQSPLADDRSVPLKATLKIGAIGLAATYAAMIPINFLWETFINSMDLPDDLQLPVTMLQQGGTPIQIFLMGVLIIFVAPVCEELAYRRVVFRYLKGRLPDWLAIALSAAIFSLMHYNLYSSIPLFVLGCGLAMVYQKSGNIIASIFMHSLFNTISFIVITTTDLTHL